MKYSAKNPLNLNTFNWDNVIPEIEKTIIIARERIEIIKNLPPSYENTILGLENCDNEATQVCDLVSLFTTVQKPEELTEKIDEINQTINDLLTDFSNDITFDKQLFDLVSILYKHIDNYDGEQKIILKDTYKGFICNGINLPKTQQLRLREIDKKIGDLTINIESNLKREYLPWVIDVENHDVSGIPDDILTLAKELAQERNHDGYSFKVSDVNFYSLMEFAENRKLRKYINEKFRSLGNNEDEFDNKKLIVELMQLRDEKAKILGYENHASFILEDRMVKNPKKVNNFLIDLENSLKESALNEFLDIQSLAKIDGLEHLYLHDESFYETKIKETQNQIDMKEIRKYFPYKKVLNGLFEFLNKMYGISFEPANIPKYHKDVEPYFVIEQGKVISVVYFDNFARDDKQSGAWMSPIVSPSKDQIPFILVACDFTPKSKNQPSRLSLNDVKTLFHEMGHALHVIFSKVENESLGGINVAWDFVELPSQIMENFILEDFVLDLISEHITTKESLPQDMRQKLRQSDKLFNAMTQLSYVGLGKIDMELHCKNPNKISFENINDMYFKCKMFKPENKKENRITNFEHILSGGYDAGFYSYQWAKVLDLNCYQIIKDNGFSPEIMNQFRNEILSVGSSRDEYSSFLAFCKRDIQIQPFLDYYGILEKQK